MAYTTHTHTEPVSGETRTTGTTAPHTTLAVAPGNAGYATEAVPLNDPHDEWGARDLLLSMVPFVVATSMRDCSFHGGLILATSWAVGLLLYRVAFWDGKRKIILPAVDICNVVLFAVILGTSYYDQHALHKWYNVIAEGALSITMLASVAAMRPFTGHYARYNKLDRGGRDLWAGDADWRKACHGSSLGIAILFAIVCLLSLIPIETGHYTNFHGLNVVFNYVLPLIVALASPILMQIVSGKKYVQVSTRDRRAPVAAAVPGTGAAAYGGAGVYGASPVGQTAHTIPATGAYNNGGNAV